MPFLLVFASTNRRCIINRMPLTNCGVTIVGRRTLLAILAALGCTTASVQAKIVSNLGVAIQSCVVNEKNGATNGINIVFYNAHVSAATEVDFTVEYGGHTYTLSDKGNFTRGAPINHNLTNALVGAAWNGPRTNLCTPRRVLLANGKTLQ